MVHVNDATPQDDAAAPFGGIGSDPRRVEVAGVVLGREHDPDLTSGKLHPLAVGQRERGARVQVRP